VPDFNRMTIVAATEVLCDYKSHNDIELLQVEWGIAGRCGASSKSGRAAALANIAIEENGQVITENGRITLSDALINVAINAPSSSRDKPAWRKLVAGLRLDGFEISGIEQVDPDLPSWMSASLKTASEPIVRRMLPVDLPGLDMREAENEVDYLLQKHGFATSSGHVKRAISAFQRGDWSSSNAELRNLYEGLLNDIAAGLGYVGNGDSLAKRNFLGEGVTPPFLLSDYNEWNANTQKPQYV
jgi:hypothetical protein